MTKANTLYVIYIIDRNKIALCSRFGWEFIVSDWKNCILLGEL